ncbi:hypothetical protein TNCV_2600891 [Trichonephila clavipes]|nr:hypothetical protein TNCV_2600891 [Trichonephila clavipes]
MKKHLHGRRFVSSDEVKGASQETIRDIAKNGFQLCFKSYTNICRSVSAPKWTTLKVDVVRCCELFRDFPEVINSIVVVKIPNPTDISLVRMPF